MNPTAFDLTGTTVLVTGAARGIGRAIALEFAAAGADVAIGLRSIAEDGGLAAEIAALGRRVLPLQLDVMDLGQGRAAIDRTVQEFGRLDTLVNNAGGGRGGGRPALDVEEEDFDFTFGLNTRSAFFLSQHAAKAMKAAGHGSIVNIASMAGLIALAGEASYCIAKAAMIQMTRVHAVEWGSYGIRVNAVAPTFIRTDGTSERLDEPDFHATIVAGIAGLHRVGVPSEVSGAVAFLASPAASLITGVTLPIDGGWTAV